MSNEIAKRLSELRTKLDLTQAQFAEKLGLKYSAISMLEGGKSSLTEPNIRLICYTFGVNEAWLRDGTGEMLNEEALLSDWKKRLISLFERLSPLAQKMLIGYAEKLVADEAALRGEAEETGEESG